MKWPKKLVLIRHGESKYNELKKKKDADPLWKTFKDFYENRFHDPQTRQLAQTIREKYALGVSDYDTPLTPSGHLQARTTGMALRKECSLPDVILVSPYLRTKQTIAGICQGWPSLTGVPTVMEDRIREQEHGLSLLYNDWRVFHVMHPEQRELRDLQGQYWYEYPQGESISTVRERARSVQSMIIREYAEKSVLMVTHHLTILSFRANLERLTPEQFMDLDERQKPFNCGVTTYQGDPSAGKSGRLVLEKYNERYWS